MRRSVALAILAGLLVATARADEPRAPQVKANDADMFEPFNQKECDYPAPCGCNCDAGQAGMVKPPLGESVPMRGPNRR